MRLGLRDRLHLLLSSHGLARRLNPRNMLRWKRHPPHPAATSAPDLPTASLSPEPSISRVASAPGQIPAGQERPRQATANGRGKAPTPPLKKLVRKAQCWSPKALPSTSIIRENIAGGTIKPKGSPEFGRFEAPRNDDTASDRGVERGSPALSKAAGAALSGVGVSASKGKMGGKETSRDADAKRGAEEQPPPQPADESTTPSQPVPESGEALHEPTEEPAPQQQPAASSGWMSWWSRSSPIVPPTPAAPIPPSDPTPSHDALEADGDRGETESVRPEEPEQREDEAAAAASSEPPASAPDRTEPDPASAAGWYSYLPSMSMLPSVPVPGILSYAYPLGRSGTDKKPPPSEGKDAPAEPDPVKEPSPGSSTKADSLTEPILGTDLKGSNSDGGKPDDATAGDVAATQADRTKKDALPKVGSTWAFWYRDPPSGAKGKAAETEPGEIAVMGEGSEAEPTPVAEGDVAPPAQDNKSDTEAKDAHPSALSMWRRTKKHRPVSLDIDSILPSSLEGIRPLARASTGDPAAAPVAAPGPAPAPAPIAEQVVDPTKKTAPIIESPDKQKPNLLLPSFAGTYQMKENPSILRQVTRLVVGSSQPPPNHVFRTRSAPKIRKAIAIGVHGFFPATYLRPMIGQPTGTSLRFANLAAEAIRRWVDGHGSGSCEIEKVALEGEGRINERVDNLWKLMLNWVKQIREADLIIMACHSQGVPVGVMLLQKLIDLGIVTTARIGVCAMAGVSLGPFPDLKSSILTGSAAELWEFGNPQSNNSLRLELSLKRILDYGARITFVGSIDDQLVPMESAVYSPANHPYIYRAVFIDGRVHAPDFIAHLVGFALKMRNLGVSDHGLVRELSVALAGSLYSGEGHSRLYYDAAVYDLAIAHALETSDTAQPTPCSIPRREAGPLASANPFVLPWIMRGLLEEAYVKTELSAETEELLRQFDDWKPTNKALKDVKYRLEAVRSKL